MSDKAGFRLASGPELTQAFGAASPFGFYVLISHSGKYLPLVAKGESVSVDKREKMEKLAGVNLYVSLAEVALAPALKHSPLDVTAAEAFEDNVLGEKAGKVLKKAYRELLDLGDADPTKLTTELVGLSDAVLDVVAPESQLLKQVVLKNARNATLMNHAAAMTSIGVLCAMGNDFRSRTVFSHISQAALLMDASLGDLEDHHLDTYYRDRKELPSHLQEKIFNHPVKSDSLAQRLPIYNDTLGQLIVMHHELHNGKGYHRGLRTLNHQPLGRLLALAVDIYEMLKSSELNMAPKTLEQVLLEIEEPNVEPQLRRHSTKLVQGVQDLMGIPRKK
jgi:hypothetical protein